MSDDGLRERMSHRGIVQLTHAALMRLTGLNDEHEVSAVWTNPETMSINVMVIHPALPPVPRGVMPPLIGGGIDVEYRVIDGEVWERSKLAIADLLDELPVQP